MYIIYWNIFSLQHWLDLAKTAVKQVKGWYHSKVHKNYLLLANVRQIRFKCGLNKTTLPSHYRQGNLENRSSVQSVPLSRRRIPSIPPKARELQRSFHVTQLEAVNDATDVAVIRNVQIERTSYYAGKQSTVETLYRRERRYRSAIMHVAARRTQVEQLWPRQGRSSSRHNFSLPRPITSGRCHMKVSSSRDLLAYSRKLGLRSRPVRKIFFSPLENPSPPLPDERASRFDARTDVPRWE